MRITIVTSVLNDCEGLRHTFGGVQAQDCEHIDWVVIDGGSTDGTLEYLRELSAAAFVSEPDNGIYDAMNKGISLATGDYVVFMNAGDTFPSRDTLSRVCTELQSKSRPDVLFGGAELLFRNGATKYRSPRDISEYIWHGMPANHQATYYRRDVLERYRFDLSYPLCADYCLDCKIYVNQHRCVNFDVPLVRFRIGDSTYQAPMQVLGEAFAIQRRVLHQSLPLSVLSYLRRGLTMSAVLLYNQFAR